MSLNIERVVTGPFQENSFITWQDNSKFCIIVDPGDDAHLIIQQLENLNLEPLAVINTHAHLDHIGAISDLKEKFTIPFYLHSLEKTILDGYERDCALFGMNQKTAPTVDHWFNSETIRIKTYEILLVETPGHTPGGTCLCIDRHVFTGDTIFAGSVGRTDLPGGDWDTLSQSLIKVMNEIPSDYILHPGHGLDTNLKTEMKQNPFLIPLLNRVNSL
ncbi:MAG: MBL fold metallo-hydrolase [Candidatus Marinimicrobia bacterium]|nr:MBL fold metallo-hydrolase [Candidatus Neomarinimicrobiota bacterium]